MYKRITALVMACLLVLAVFSGCSANKETDKAATDNTVKSGTSASDKTPQKVVHDTDYDNLNLTILPGTGSKDKASDLPVPSGFTVVELWYSVGAAAGAAIEEIAMDFNNTVGKAKKVWVKPTFQGNYDATSVKLESVLASEDVKSFPDLVNVNANGMILFLDTPEFIPFSDLAKRDPDFDIKCLNANALASLTYKDKVLSYPQAISMPPLLYYNKTMFKEAGLDPEKLPKTLAGYVDILTKLTKRNEKNEVTVYGMATTPELMHLHNFLQIQKGCEYMFDNNNGHIGTPTKVLFGENGSMLKFLNEWKKLIDTGGLDYFSKANIDAFRNKKTAMVMLSSLQIQNLASTPPGFEWGVTKVPRVNDNDYEGANTGGSSMFILNRGEKQLSAVWAFLKFISLPQPSAKWFLGSGYYPQNLDAFKLPEVKKIMDANPQYNYLLKLYDESKGMTFLSPVWVPSFGDLNQFYVDTIVEFGKGKYSAEKAVEVMVTESKRVLDTYNRLKK